MGAKLKQLLAAGQLVRVFGLGQLCHPKFVEIIGYQGGYDDVWLDQEHTGLSIAQLEEALGELVALFQRLLIRARVGELRLRLPPLASELVVVSGLECELQSLVGLFVAARELFDLLLDVEMPVSVSFGRTHLPLKDVLKLTTGSIVELSRAVAEPVEILVNGRVIARGEVVVVEGNFGVRIQQVISPQDRVKTLQ